LYKVLNDNDPEDRMPPAPMAALPTSQRALILKWIQQGAIRKVKIWMDNGAPND
jgi:hypothetical protein